MIRQLRQLTRPVPALGSGATAIAVYAREREGRFVEQPAAEQGYEGVACIDDAARAVVLYAGIWKSRRLEWARSEASGLLRFVCAMQARDGAFVNFISGWGGRRQLHTPTSRPTNGPWHARGMHAAACGTAAFADEGCARAFERGFAVLDQPTPYLDVRAVAILAALEYLQVAEVDHVAERALAWAEEIMDARVGDVLPDQRGRPDVHLWGHLQEAALARAGVAFRRDDLIQAAARSTDAILAPAVELAFAGPRSLPFEVSCTIAGLDAVAAATAEFRFAELATLGRAWFEGRNAAGEAIYNRVRGCVYDGIDGGTINRNSGAESNIEGGLALIDTLPWDDFHPTTVRARVESKGARRTL